MIEALHVWLLRWLLAHCRTRAERMARACPETPPCSFHVDRVRYWTELAMQIGEGLDRWEIRIAMRPDRSIVGVLGGYATRREAAAAAAVLRTNHPDQVFEVHRAEG